VKSAAVCSPYNIVAKVQTFRDPHTMASNPLWEELQLRELGGAHGRAAPLRNVVRRRPR